MTGTEEPNTQQQGDPAELGDAGKRAIQAERARAEAAEKALKDAESRLKALEDQGLSELEKARAEIDTLKAENSRLADENVKQSTEITRLNVGIDEGLPKNLIARLQGTDEDTLKSDAASLKELIPANTSPFPKADPSQGAKGSAGEQSTAQQFADAIENAFK